jgi:hypothetical protein
MKFWRGSNIVINLEAIEAAGERLVMLRSGMRVGITEDDMLSLSDALMAASEPLPEKPCTDPAKAWAFLRSVAKEPDTQP